MTGNQWEQVVDPVLETVADDATAGDGPGQGTDQAPEETQVSGETTEASVEEIIERALNARLDSLRQDLGGEIERRVQSFSDKTAHRLSEAQRSRLQMLDQLMEGLQDQLGPDFDQVKRQKQLDILLDTGQVEPATENPADAQPPAGTVQAGPESDLAQAYLSRLGEPSEWSPEAQQAIKRELSQAQGWQAWMAVVDKYAAQRPGRSGQQAQPTRAARAQPIQQGRPSGQLTPEQLQKAYNVAANDGNLQEMDRLGKIIDQLLRR